MATLEEYIKTLNLDEKTSLPEIINEQNVPNQFLATEKIIWRTNPCYHGTAGWGDWKEVHTTFEEACKIAIQLQKDEMIRMQNCMKTGNWNIEPRVVAYYKIQVAKRYYDQFGKYIATSCGKVFFRGREDD